MGIRTPFAAGVEPGEAPSPIFISYLILPLATGDKAVMIKVIEMPVHVVL